MIESIDQLLLLFAATARFAPDDTVREVLGVAQKRLLVLRYRWLQLNKPFVVAIVGLSNVGKSTLMNALLGDKYAPAGNYPCTATPVEFSYGEQLKMTVHLANDFVRPQWSFTDTTELLNRLMLVADEKQKTTVDEVSRVEVTAPLSMLQDGLVLADTPGFNAVQLDERAGTHQKTLDTYLRSRASQVFWVVRAAFGVDKMEKAFFERFLGELCDDIVVTGSESLDETQRLRWRKRVAANLRGYSPRFHFVSGLDGSEARRAGDLAQLDRAGICNLETQLRELAAQAVREQVLKNGVVELTRQLGDWARTYWADKAQTSGHFWNPPEWATLAENCKADERFQQLVAQLDVPH